MKKRTIPKPYVELGAQLEALVDGTPEFLACIPRIANGHPVFDVPFTSEDGELNVISVILPKETPHRLHVWVFNIARCRNPIKIIHGPAQKLSIGHYSISGF